MGNQWVTHPFLHENEVDPLDFSIIEREYFGRGMQYIGGIDEAGRGPLAGPVVAAVVFFSSSCRIPDVNDSKALSHKRRELLYDEIKAKALAIGIGIVWPEVIDQINILRATHRAMGKAVAESGVEPDLLLVDGLPVPTLDAAPQLAIVKGDALCFSIAAASIVAKVERDWIMIDLEQKYPGYGFGQNKGYGTAEHLRAIDRLGLCPQHRRTFCHRHRQVTLDLSS
ncbi:MAG: ribonuclease HII [Limnochordia bacterium]|nr:ribonuclease HII [Limnochordia bacterium]MDD4516905.1 ribonuclease HII [Limnochordia bacterium]